jgi:2-dehydro-3-deoxyphosphogluconate aldolase/(4S)-4-hydroxy-2-oxoglutarate aldolase
MNTGLLQILKNKIIAIIRGASPDDVSRIAIALQQGGVTILEMTLNSQSAFAVIKELSNKLSNGMLIGAGTVLDAEAAKAAIDAGARFIVSPNLNVQTIDITRKYGAVSIPGAYTATEVVNAYVNGETSSKFFLLLVQSM